MLLMDNTLENKIFTNKYDVFGKIDENGVYRDRICTSSDVFQLFKDKLSDIKFRVEKELNDFELTMIYDGSPGCNQNTYSHENWQGCVYTNYNFYIEVLGEFVYDKKAYSTQFDGGEIEHMIHVPSKHCIYSYVVHFTDDTTIEGSIASCYDIETGERKLLSTGVPFNWTQFDSKEKIKMISETIMLDYISCLPNLANFIVKYDDYTTINDELVNTINELTKQINDLSQSFIKLKESYDSQHKTNQGRVAEIDY